MIYYILIVITIIIIVLIFNNYKNNNIIFLENNETSEFLIKDIDNYVKNLNDIDLYARKVKTKEEYIKIISNNTLNFNENQKDKLIKCTAISDEFFLNYENYYINGSELVKIKWIFGLVGNNYEEGMPHTRNDIIFISNNIINNEEEILIRILIHEKIHIYQRYYNMDEIIKKMGYKFSRKKYNIPLIRSNPDLNDNIYKDHNNEELIALYNSDKPSSINDVKISNFSSEHPYEKMAYEISMEYNKNLLNKYKNII